MNNISKVVFLFAAFFIWQLSSAQGTDNKIPDSYVSGTISGTDSIQQKQYIFIKELYDSLLHSSSNGIHNGREYEYYFNPRMSTPLIPGEKFPSGTIIIQGKAYNHVILQYDTYKDLVIYNDPDHILHNTIIPIVINPFIIDEFTLKISGNNLKFRYIKFPNHPDGGLTSGFYELMYDGASRYLIRHRSILVIEGGKQIYKYSQQRYIINKGNEYKIKGERSLLKALSDKRPDIKKFIKSAGISVRMAEKAEMLRILTFYDSLELP